MKQGREQKFGRWVNVGTLVYVDETGGIRIRETEHFDSLVSAEFWVLDTQLETMYDHIRQDWAHRHLWHQAWRDVRDQMTLRGLANKTESLSPAVSQK